MVPVTRSRVLRRLFVSAAVGLGLVVLSATPAAADPPGPTDYRSEIDDVVPDTDGMEASIVGGDGFLLLEVADGTTAEVRGYSGEPYLRFAADGTVEENQASPAAFLNASRTRTDDGGIDPDAEPQWNEVASDGRWAWHDHRIHFMGGGVPQAARTEEGVGWEVPVAVDGEEVVITGDYRYVGAASPLPWIGLAVVVSAGIVLGPSRLVSPMRGAGAMLLIGGIGGVVAGMAQRSVDPPGASTSTLVVILPAVAVVTAALALLGKGRVSRAVAALAGAGALGGWALVRIQVLWKAILPTSLPAAGDRALTAFALGVVVGASVLVIRSGALAPDLSDLDGPEQDVAPA